MVNEDDFLKQILGKLGKENLLQGNEDAIAVEITSQLNLSNVLVINTDSMSWSSDALPPDISLHDFGQKLVTMTISDVIIKGATPKYFLCTITIPKEFSSNNISDLFEGIQNGCQQYNISYLGGDLGNSLELVLSGIVIGFAKKNQLLKRSDAQDNDLICTTGYFGYTGLGYKYYLENNSLIKESPEIIELVNKKLSKPKALLKWLPFLKKYCNATIDSSDGLFKSLHHIANESKKKVCIDKLPTDPLLIKTFNNSLQTLDHATLYGGEEFEIIFTVSPKSHEMLLNDIQKFDIDPPMVIGKVKSGKISVFYKNEEIKGSNHNWNSFSGFKKNEKSIP